MEHRPSQKASSCWVKFLHFVEPQKSLPLSQEVHPVMNHFNPINTHIVWLRCILIFEHLVLCLFGCLFPSRILDITTLTETGDSLSRLFLLMWFQVIKKTSVTEPEDSSSFPRSLPMYSILSQFIPVSILRMPFSESLLPVTFIFTCLPFASLSLSSSLTIARWWWTHYVPPKRRRSLPGCKSLVNRNLGISGSHGAVTIFFIFLDVTLWSLVDHYHLFGGTSCLHLQSRVGWYTSSLLRRQSR